MNPAQLMKEGIRSLRKEGPAKTVLRLKSFLTYQAITRKRALKYTALKTASQNGQIERNVQGSRMLLNLNDEGISADLALDGIREPLSTRAVQEELKEGQMTIDIGANIGYYALMEARKVGKKGRVYAIEPVPENYRRLVKNIELNGYKNIEPYPLAIGDTTKRIKMYLSPHSNLHSMAPPKGKEIKGTVNVDMTTLDAFIKKRKIRPSFIRMDVEGYEYQIIKGMRHILRKRDPLLLFIELHPHIMGSEKTGWVLSTLQKHGFRTKKVIRSLTIPQIKAGALRFDYTPMSMEEMLKDGSILKGEKGAFEIFFER